MSADLSSHLDQVKGLLFDFDGPVCGVFHTYKASVVADDERTFLAGKGIELPEPLASAPNPLKILAWIGDDSPLAAEADNYLCGLETLAVDGAAPTKGAADALVAAHQHVKTAIVSNNAGAAVEKYLSSRGLVGCVDAVVGRPHAWPSKMKPHPYSLELAADFLGVSLADCALVGDSVSDIEACKRAGVFPIGYAKTPQRGVELAEAGAAIVVDEMSELADYYGGRR
ncbi:HAD family hydrolase [Fodinicola feengrottensis]|uniref:HAD family hydrolase n=1 Tax=Fodinicola feengrottensis TaxID=435914 RepID=A0ABN2H3H6_9ACTN